MIKKKKTSEILVPDFTSTRKGTSLFIWIMALGFFTSAVFTGIGCDSSNYRTGPAGEGQRNVVENNRSDDSSEIESPVIFDEEHSSAALQEFMDDKLLIDSHEHIQSLEQASIYLAAMDYLGIGKMCLMGSSKFTLTLNEKDGFIEVDENNEELIKIIEAYPERFEAWPTVDPLDRDKLKKFKSLVKQGATGLKLYLGHGYVTADNEYMFHPIAMDDPGMMSLYRYCEENYIPVCLHVNPYGGKKGFAEEFISVLTLFPDLKVIAPHFILSSIASDRLREYLDTFPNLYSDISFGDYYVKPGLERISEDPDKFRELFLDYPTRFLYGTDLVLTEHPTKDMQWVVDQHQAYLDMLTKLNYTTPLVDEPLKGLALPPDLLANILFKNFIWMQNSKPENTEITRGIDWSRMNQDPTGREQGEIFPPE